MKITKGLNLPISGKPEQTISDHSSPTKVAVLGRDYHDLRPAMKVEEGDHVKIGQVLFTDRKNAGVNFTAPGAGTVKAINRGPRRVLNSVVIELDGQEESIDFGAHAPDELASLDADVIREKLIESGQWVAFRSRPYSKPAAIDSSPTSIFVNVMDTRPLAADPLVVLREDDESFLQGMQLISRLAPKVFVCHLEGAAVPNAAASNISYHGFEGVHPAGLPGTHIHFLDPVSEDKSVWYINYQDVSAIGKLFTTGKLFVDRVVALGGPPLENPRLVRTRLGVCTDELVRNEMSDVDQQVRVISGSVFGGHRSAGWSAYMGRYNLQVSVLDEGEPREFLHWLNPMLKQFSVLNVFFSKGLKDQEFNFSSTRNGSERAMVPLGNYERVMPLDILPTQLLRAILTRDTVLAQELGALELDEEDLSLCTFVCHGKYEYGSALRECLRMIEKGE
uniref:Na(+)-translocating NADH-quinone reductase subunit A n=1 Tax=uncultured Thiotrichaceae bacterium TaxID=298394 RepID=A0A6S6UMY1_9GAMM|nr:MAG: Na(+)-translocating NADH-quinone reductase subunit A (EC [uncultured Thiotrichaceae bacterium]